MKKYKINLDFHLKDLMGNEIKTSKANEIIANTIAASGEKEAAEALSLAIDLIKTPQMEITNKQLSLIKRVLENSNLNVLTRGRLEDYLNELK